MDSFTEDLSQAFIHEPFSKELCRECHLSRESDSFLFSKLETRSQSREQTIGHSNLPDKEFSNLTVCSTCHPESVGAASHPVNILPAKGMSIPPEYTTLADGRISCITCHKHHASNIEYRLVKPRDQGFCVGCHRSKKKDAAGTKFQCRGKCSKEL